VGSAKVNYLEKTDKSTQTLNLFDSWRL